MAGILQLLDSPSAAIATGALLTYPIPRGKPIRGFWVFGRRSNGTTALTRTELLAELNKFEGFANTDKISQWTIANAIGVGMNYRDGYEGAAADDGAVFIPFVRQRLNDAYIVRPGDSGPVRLDGESCRFGTIGITSLQLQITLGTITNLAILDVYAEYADVEDELPGYFIRVVQGAESGFGTSEKKIDTIVPRTGSRLIAVHISGYGSGVLQQASVKHSERELQRINTAATNGGLNARRLKHLGRLPQASMYHLDMLLNNSLGDSVELDPPRDPKVMLTWSTAPDSGIFNVLLETFEEFGRTFGKLSL